MLLPIVLACLHSLTGCERPSVSSPELLNSKRITYPWAEEDLGLEFETTAPAILVEVLGEDAHFRSQVIDSSGDVITDVELPYLRSAPVYHLVEAEQGKPVRLRIQPTEWTRNAAFTINHYALPSESNADLRMLNAWRSLTAGIQLLEGENEAAWEPKLLALQEAAESFSDLGKQAPELWARYFGAYFRYFPLYRYQESLEEAEAVLSDARREGLPNLEMLAHQLAGQILIEQDPDIYGPEKDIYAEARNHFEAALDLAKAGDNGFETVWTYNNLGITSKYQGRPEQSLDEYGAALDLAIELQDDYLVSLIGMNMAVSQESMGLINQAIETLHRIENELVVSGAPAELEHVWSLLGGYYLKRYEFPEALKTLDQALALSEELGIAESLGRNQLLLAQTYRELGQMEKSLQNVELAIPNLEASRSGRGLRRAYALTADLHRQGQRFEAMQKARLMQEQYLRTESDRAHWIWGSAQDALALGKLQEALQLYEVSAAAFESTPFTYIGQLATLHACVLRSERGSSGACSRDRIRQDSSQLLGHEASSYQLEGRFMMATVLASEGHTSEAQTEMDALVEDLRFYRNALPGILGAWYWDARKEIFDFYLELALVSGKDTGESALASLQALNRLRNLGLQAQSTVQTVDNRNDELRQFLAVRDEVESVAELEKVQRSIDLALLDQRRSGEAKDALGAVPDLRERIAGLPDEWSFLTFHLDDERALAWAGTNNGLQVIELGRGDELRELVQKARQEIQTINSQELNSLLSDLGEKLIVPVADSVQPNILFLGAGILSDFPLEALIVDDQYLIENYRIQNVLAFGSLAATIEHNGNPLRPEKLFLAGDPNLSDASMAPLPGSASELHLVAASFPQATSEIYAQDHLTKEVFGGDNFSTSNLVHIASHATVDTVYPELSRIELTGDFLTPADLVGQQIAADLVVLSACSTVGLNRFEYDSHLGFVSEFIVAGADGVIASLWPVPDRRTAEFFEVLYSDLSGSNKVAESLRNAKLKMIDAGEAGVELWAAFQLFAR